MSLVSTSATSRPGYADVYGRFWERVGREPLPGEMDHLLSIWERMGWNDVFAQMDVFKAQTPATGGLTPGNATPRGVGFRRAGGFGNLSFGGPSFTPPPGAEWRGRRLARCGDGCGGRCCDGGGGQRGGLPAAAVVRRRCAPRARPRPHQRQRPRTDRHVLRR